MPPGEFSTVSQQVRHLLDGLAYQVARARRSHQPDAVHDLRISIRRFGQALAAFKPRFGPKKVKRIRGRLKRMMDRAGKVRDFDITLEHVKELKEPDLVSALEEQRREAERSLRAFLAECVASKMSSKWCVALDLDSPEPTIPAGQSNAAGRLVKMTRQWLKLGQSAGTGRASSADLHRLRIAAKKLRYTLEVATPADAPRAAEMFEQLKALQRLLGRINDLRTARTIVSVTGRYPEIDATLRKKQRRLTARFRQFWEREFSSVTAEAWLQVLEEPAKRPMRRAEPAAPLARRAAAGA